MLRFGSLEAAEEPARCRKWEKWQEQNRRAALAILARRHRDAVTAQEEAKRARKAELEARWKRMNRKDITMAEILLGDCGREERPKHTQRNKLENITSSTLVAL